MIQPEWAYSLFFYFLFFRQAPFSRLPVQGSIFEALFSRLHFRGSIFEALATAHRNTYNMQ